ncbi:MAG: Bug family tripartite tricarboxylate transporter substrate binding protein [Burkholderiales bacterium]
MKPLMILLMRCLFGTVAVLACLGAAAQPYPNRPIRLIVPFPPGGGADVFARAVAPRMQELWGQSIIIDNRAGGNAMIGMDMVAKAPADGYTMGVITLTHGINASLFPKAPYNLVRDLAAVTIGVHSPMLVVTHPSMPVATLGELVALLRTRTHSAPSSGTGTPPHIGLELFKQIAKFEVVHVPYKGGAPSMIDLIAGRTDFAVSNLVESIQHVKAGKLRAIAIPSDSRHPQLPDVPTTAEAGLPQFLLTNWVGLVTASGVPREILAAMSDTALRAIRSPDVNKRLIDLTWTPAGLGWEAGQKHIEAEVRRWGEVIRSGNIQPD